MTHKSKSKTFPKGTTFLDIKDWIMDYTEGSPDRPYACYNATSSKVLITITKYSEKDERTYDRV